MEFVSSRTSPVIDPSKVVLFGRSLGGAGRSLAEVDEHGSACLGIIVMFT